MRIYKRKTKARPDEAIKGYPIVNQYKYLGVNLSHNMDAREHIKIAKMKAAYTRTRLFRIRKINSLQANRNLFKVLVLPCFRLVGAYYDKLAKNVQEDIQRMVRV